MRKSITSKENADLYDQVNLASQIGGNINFLKTLLRAKDHMKLTINRDSPDGQTRHILSIRISS